MADLPQWGAGGDRLTLSMRDVHHVGRAGEQAAAAYLAQAGLQPVAANVGTRLGELDLVMLDHDAAGEILVFVEVRYRRHAQFGGGAASVDARKRQKLVQAAGVFLAAHPHYRDHPCRFDVIAASGDPDAPALEWIQDAFRVGD